MFNKKVLSTINKYILKNYILFVLKTTSTININDIISMFRGLKDKCIVISYNLYYIKIIINR